ncbi:MAG: cyclic peptide export ABC transporter [Balneolaceae bacterium]|nr:cyclic peptide export ABC transporter [Balneolaceae bacterium]
MKLLSLLIRASLPLFSVSAASSILTGLFSTLIIKLIHSAINNEGMSVEGFVTAFGLYLLGYLVFSVVASFCISLLTKRIVHNLRIDLTRKIIKADYSLLENLKAKLLPVLTDDISTIGIVIERLPSVANGVAMVVGIMVYMMWLSPPLSLLTLGAFLLIFAINKLSLKFIARFSKISRAYTNRVYEAFEGLVYGLKSLKISSRFRKSFIDRTIIPGSSEQTRYYLYYNVLNSTTSRMNDIVLFLFLAVVIVMIYLFNFVTMDFFNKYLTLVLFMLAPLSTISGFLSTMKKIEASVEQIDQLGIDVSKKTEFREIDPDDTLVSSTSADTNSVIELEDMVYTHEKDETRFTLGPINLSIEPGKILFVTGGNGSGKTTLIKVLCGLYLPKSGAMSYRGVKITEGNISAYRDLFGVIFTDSYLFNHLDHIPDEVIQNRGPELLKLLGLQDKVSIKGSKFSSVNLSEGQKKRLVLLKILLEDKDIYVFDEWVAYQDQDSKKLFFTKILPYLRDQGKTVINISHDSRYEHIADQKIHLRNGKIDELQVA